MNQTQAPETDTVDVTRQLTWPTVEEAAACTARVIEATRALEDLDRMYQPLLNAKTAPSLKDGAPPATLEEIGVLGAAIRRAEFELDAAVGFLDELRAKFAAAAVESVDFDRLEDPESFARVQAAERERRAS